MTKYKSKTFSAEHEFSELIDWFVENIDTKEREVIYNGAEPSMDVIVETNFKYKVTITKIEDDRESV